MSYHSFTRSFEENVEMLYDDGARLARLIHLCKGEAGRAIKCCSLTDPEQGHTAYSILHTAYYHTES